MRTVELLHRHRRALVIALLVVWVAIAAAGFASSPTAGIVLALIAGPLEILVFLAVPHAAAAATRFDGSYASGAGVMPDPVDPGPHPPAQIRP